MFLRVYQKTVRVDVLRQTHAGQKHVDELVYLSNVKIAFQKLQVSQKFVVWSNFEALQILLTNELENYELIR